MNSLQPIICLIKPSVELIETLFFLEKSIDLLVVGGGGGGGGRWYGPNGGNQQHAGGGGAGGFGYIEDFQVGGGGG